MTAPAPREWTDEIANLLGEPAATINVITDADQRQLAQRLRQLAASAPGRWQNFATADDESLPYIISGMPASGIRFADGHLVPADG